MRLEKQEERKRFDDEDSTSGSKFFHMEKPNEVAEKSK